MPLYNNIPRSDIQSSSNNTVKYFNNFYNVPIDLDGTDIAAVTGFFENAGFNKESADSVAMIMLSQAKNTNITAFQLLDSLDLVGQILNYNRFKTSSLGISIPPTPADEIQRNILA
jgi:hypothetical protein